MTFSSSRRQFLASTAAVTGYSAALHFPLFANAAANSDLQSFVCVSKECPRYFELDNGKPYIPIGLNMIRQPWDDDENMTKLENDWFKQLQANRANFIRVWLSSPSYEIERERSGNMDEKRAEKFDKLLALAEKYGIRLKLCTEHFRHLGEGQQTWAGRTIYRKENGGTAADIKDYFLGESGREHYKKKLDWYTNRCGSKPVIFGWELWNEMDAVNQSNAFWRQWSKEMLAELHKRFPKNLAMQSLGSFDDENKKSPYTDLCNLPCNDVLQVHRYLDLGAKWKICGTSVAELSNNAVKFLLSLKIPKPVLLAESGAVEPNHSGPFKLYEKDKDGIIFHDVLFAPFFSGAAGPGHIWHWDHYVAKNNLWFHLGRFANVAEGLDPRSEQFEPFEIEHKRVYLYGLKGKTKTIIWCRDKENTWQTELEEGKAPETLTGIEFDNPAAGKTVKAYNPWEDKWNNGSKSQTKITIPSFRRSAVIVIS